MGQKTALTVRECGQAEAAQRLANMHALDPRKRMQAGELPALQGQAFVIEGEGVEVCYVLQVFGEQVWCAAAKGQAQGVDLVQLMDEVATQQAMAAGLARIGTETARPGLVKKLKAQGWKVTGWILHKELT